MFQIAKMIALLPQNTSAASVLYFKKFPFCPLGQTLECLSHLNLGFKKEWELAAKWVYAASLNIKLSMALGGWRSTLAAVSYPVPGWGADSQGVGPRMGSQAPPTNQVQGFDIAGGSQASAEFSSEVLAAGS